MAALSEAVGAREMFRLLVENPDRKESSSFDRGLRTLDAGGDLACALEATGLFDPLEIRVSGAGSDCGRVPWAFNLMGDYNDWKARVAGDLFSKLLYPVALIHMAVFLPAVLTWFHGGFWAFFREVGFFLLVLYFPVVLFVGLRRLSLLHPRVESVFDGVLLALPGAGTCVRYFLLARAATAAHALYASGLSVLDALGTASRVCGNSVLRDALARVRARVESGADLRGAVGGETALPAFVREMWSTGDASGKMEEMLYRSAKMLTEEGESKLRRSVLGFSLFVYILAILLAAVKIASFWSGYFGNLAGGPSGI